MFHPGPYGGRRLPSHLMTIIVKDRDDKTIGSVGQFGTSWVAEQDAMRRAAKLAADHVGVPWAVAWIDGHDYGPKGNATGGRIERPDSYEAEFCAGRTIATWRFLR